MASFRTLLVTISTSLRQKRRRSLCAALGLSALGLAGCGQWREEARVRDRFHAIYGCSNAHVVATSDNAYRAEGCGVVASFVCFKDASAYRRYRSSAPLLEQTIRGDDTCIQEHSERVAVKQHATPSVTVREARDSSVLRTTLRLRGASVSVAGAPQRDQAHLVFYVRPIVARSASSKDEALLWVDGNPVTTSEFERVEDTRGVELRFLADAAPLRGLRDAMRVSLNVAGIELELDEASRHALAELEMRFREQTSMLESSGGETPQAATP